MKFPMPWFYPKTIIESSEIFDNFGKRVNQRICELVLQLGNQQAYLQQLLLYSNKLHASLVAQTVKNLSAMLETWVRSLGREDPLEKGMGTNPVFLPGESLGQRSLYGPHTICGITKSHTWLRDQHTHTTRGTRRYWAMTAWGLSYSRCSSV